MWTKNLTLSVIEFDLFSSSKSKETMGINSSVFSDYIDLYRFLAVMDGPQIWKLRKIATGVLEITSFSEEEIAVLEARLQLESLSAPTNQQS